MIIQLLISIAFLSLIQTVFSKRSADTLQCYFGTSKASVQSNVGNSYRIRKHGLAFVQSRAARYLNSKSEQVYSTVSSTGTTKRNLFSFNLNDVMTKDSKQKDEKDNSKLEDEINEIVEDKGSSLNGDIFGLSSWAKGLVSTKELSRAKSTDERNWFDTDIKTPKEDEPKSENSKSSDFPLASLINVEALLMASGKLPADSEADPGTAWLADMLSQSASKGATPTSPETSNIIENVNDDAYDIAKGPRSELSLSTEFVLNQVTQKLESFLNDATASFSQEGLQSLILTAARSLSVDQNADVLKSTFDNIVATAENIAREQGVDVSEAAAQARATSKVTTEFIRVANGVLLSGYVSGDDMSINIDENKNLAKEMKISLDTTSDAKPLFHRFESVQSISSADFRRVSKQGAVNAQLAGAIYQDMIPNVHKLGHSMVANGTSADVAWMVTDSIGYNSDFEPTSDTAVSDPPTLVRTITIRGFDASDEDVDRERLVTEICNAGKVPLTDDLPGLQVHRGLLAIAKEIYEDIKPFIDLAGPTHKIVLNGHSIGGALANLILMLMTVERGSIFVQEKISRVYTFGSSPIAKTDPKIRESNDSSGMYDCSVLEALGLPSDIVFGFVEPWDPIVRLFSPIDALYPLIGDIGEDGVTIYANGPPRTLRPIVRAILENWEKWPRFRDDNQDVMKQDYMSMGVQHLLMPDSGRYLTDRLLSVNVNAFPVDDVLRVSSRELYGALEEAFPLDVFSISLVPVAIRSFIHHFFPAYMDGFDHYVTKEEQKTCNGSTNAMPANGSLNKEGNLNV